MSHTLAAPNQALEPTPYSLRSCVAPASRRGSPRALGTTLVRRNISLLELPFWGSGGVML
jgi:hypothetical protein